MLTPLLYLTMSAKLLLLRFTPFISQYMTDKTFVMLFTHTATYLK